MPELLSEFRSESTLLLKDDASVESCDALLFASEPRSLVVSRTSFFVFSEQAGPKRTSPAAATPRMHLRAIGIRRAYPEISQATHNRRTPASQHAGAGCAHA